MRKHCLLALLLLANLANGQLKWNWAHPQPQGNDIRWIKVWDANTWYAVGYSQTFMKTSNGGATWTTSHQSGWPQTSTATSQQNNNNTAWFFSQNSGLVAGQGQGIARTLDGGATWDTIRVLAGTTVGGYNAFHFINNTTGFLAGNANVRVMKTVNGGLTWTQLPNIPSATYNDVYAPDTNNIFAASASGRIVHTSNAGATWDTIATGSTSTITDLEFVSPTLAYASGNPARLAYSTNGGLAWTSVTPPSPRGIQKLKVVGSKVFLVGDYNNIYTTTDNGASWDSIRFTTPSQFPSFIQYAFDNVGNTMVIGGSLGLINNSLDNGVSWQNKNHFLSQVNGNAVFAFNGSSGVWMAGTGGDVIYSSNGGNIWSLRNSGVTTTLYEVHFITPTVGFVGGDGGVLRKTTDGGLTWTAKTYSSPTHRVTGVDFVNATTGWACGGLPVPSPAGSIAKTTDAGETWVAQTPFSAASFVQKIDMVDASNGWYLGLNSIVGRTTDGGTTWENRPTPTGFSGSDLKAFDINTAILVGTGTTAAPAKIFKTTNGGTSWDSIPSPTLPGPFSVTWFATDWVNPNVGMVAGSSGLSARTTNGGLTWSPAVWTGGNQTVRGLVMTAADTAYSTAGSGGSGSGGHVFKFAGLAAPPSGLAGNKTVGGASPDYPTLKAALRDLTAQGVAPGGVTFLLRSGTYNEDSLIVKTFTSNSAKRVTIKPDVGATVVINVRPPSTAFDFAVKIDSTSYVTIDGSNNNTTSRDLTINATGGLGRRGIWVSASSTNSVIKNCIITAGRDTATLSVSYIAIDYRFTGAGQNPSNLLCENNLLRYAYTGVRIDGATATDPIVSPIVRNNVIDSVANAGIFSQFHSNALFHNNDVNVKRGSAATMYGIHVGPGTSAARVYNNRVHDLNQLNTTTSTTNGIFVSGTSTLGQHSVFNNFVWGITVPATGTGPIYGIYSGTTNTAIPDTITFNSVNLSGTSGGIRNSYAFYKGVATGPAIVWNNILHNTRSDATGNSAAIGKTSAATSLISNNNNLYVPTTTDTLANIGAIGSVRYKTLAAWRAANASDAQSFTENSPFVSATDLHLLTTVPTQNESGGTPVSGITTDIDGNTRNANYPDVGADEGTFMLLDLTGPAISHTPLGNSPSTAGRVASALIADPSGLATGAGAPRLWHRTGTTGAFAAVVADSIRAGTYFFTVPGRPASSTVQYYIAAQDLSTNNNVSTLPSGGSGINPPGSTAPSTVFSYLVQNAIPTGSYTVGTGGNFPTLDSLFRRLSTDGILGPVTFNLIDTQYVAPSRPFTNLKPAEPKFVDMDGTREQLFEPSVYGDPWELDLDNAAAIDTATLVGPIPGASAVNRVTIRPAAARAVRITATGAHALRLLHASWVTVDGINSGGASLTIRATAGTGILVDGNSDNCIIQNISFATPGFACITTRGNNVITPGSAPDSTLIRRNTFGGYSLQGVFAGSGSLIQFGTRITENICGGPTDSLAQTAITLQNTTGASIDNNRIQNVVTSAVTGMSGIGLQPTHKRTLVFNNIIRDIRQRPTTGRVQVSGIFTIGQSADTSSALIYNNMIYNLDNQATDTLSLIRGIYVSLSNRDVVAYNSVHLTGTDPANVLTFALSFGSLATGGGPSSFLNNIAVNERTATATGRATAFYSYSTTGGFTSNNNDLYVPVRARSFVAGQTTTNYATLDDWRATGRDSNSVSVLPIFRAPDLHIDTTVATPINGGATPVAGITVDFDGQTRNAGLPDIGADEFFSPLPPPAPGWTLNTSGTTLGFYSVKAVNQEIGWAAGAGGSVRRTVNRGLAWSSVSGPPISGDVYAIEALDENTAFVTTSAAATNIYRTTNGGATWATVFAQAGGFINAIKMLNSANGIAVGDPVGTTFTILRTTDGGATWARLTTEPTPVANEFGLNNSLATSDTTHIWFGSNQGRVYRSTNAGATWASSTMPFAGEVDEVAFNGVNFGVAGGASAAARSTDGGVTWTSVTTGGTGNVLGLSATAENFWAAQGNNVYRSTNNGATWATSLTGTIGTMRHCDFVQLGSATRGWAVTATGGIAAAYFNLTDVNTADAGIPTTYALDQNYPNPFNPITTIRFALPKLSNVTIKIYNIIGQEVATLVEGVREAGFYTQQWNGHNQYGNQVATGVYFYRIEAKPADGGAPFTSLKKMLLIK